MKLVCGNVEYEYETLGDVPEKGIDYYDFYGRVIISYHKKMQNQFSNAKKVIDYLIVREILSTQFRGFENEGLIKPINDENRFVYNMFCWETV